MAITEETRFRLHERLKDRLGEEEATTLMEHLPPVGWADVATKQDVEYLRGDVGRHEAATKKDFDGVRAELSRHAAATAKEFDQVRADIVRVETVLSNNLEHFRETAKHDLRTASAELRGEMVNLRAEMGVGFADLARSVERTLRIQTIVLMFGMPAFISGLDKVLGSGG